MMPRSYARRSQTNINIAAFYHLSMSSLSQALALCYCAYARVPPVPFGSATRAGNVPLLVFLPGVPACLSHPALTGRRARITVGKAQQADRGAFLLIV